jgi:hypothetical protein
MDTGGARGRGPIARLAIVGAIALAVVVGCGGLAAISAPTHSSDTHHAVVAARDSKVSLAAGAATRTRGLTWFASLLGAIGCAAFGAQLLRTRRGRDVRRDLRRLALRLRAPPRFLVAH